MFILLIRNTFNKKDLKIKETETITLHLKDKKFATTVTII